MQIFAEEATTTVETLKADLGHQKRFDTEYVVVYDWLSGGLRLVESPKNCQVEESFYTPLSSLVMDETSDTEDTFVAQRWLPALSCKRRVTHQSKRRTR